MPKPLIYRRDFSQLLLPLAGVFFFLGAVGGSDQALGAETTAPAKRAVQKPFAVEHYRKLGLLPPTDAATSQARASVLENGTRSRASLTFDRAGVQPLEVAAAPRLVNTRVILANTGTGLLKNPWVVANGTRNWFSTTTMAKEAAGSDAKPETRAFRIWDFVRRNRYHWSPAENGREIHSPVKLLNVYGYGFCDDSATILEALWKQSGFEKARCCNIGPHVVSEVFYEDGWHVLDADMELFYPLQNNKGAAGIAELVADPQLVHRVCPDLYSSFTTGSKHKFFERNWDTSFTMAMTLRPGELLERCHYNWGKYHDNFQKQQPPLYGNGRQRWSPNLGDPQTARVGFSGLENVAWTSGGIQPEKPGQNAVLTVPMRSAYVYVGGAVEVKLQAPSRDSYLQVQFRSPGRPAQRVADVRGPFDGVTSIPLNAVIRPLTARACYDFDLILTLVQPPTARPTGKAIRLEALAVTGEIQCAPWSLPALAAGRDNQVSASFDDSPGAQLMVQFEWVEGSEPCPTAPPQNALHPMNLARVSTRTLELAWESLGANCPDLWREVVVSWDPDGFHPVSPHTIFREAMSNSWTIPDGWLLPGNQYYWRVRESDALSDWSPAWSFTVQDEVL